mmetsp:Transcript_34220/g.110536  ORF Transcript_34220/g.110536 Transcript_34220/m.110536 type:complete len:222 (-) Transcript_34220:622-1287(-)
MMRGPSKPNSWWLPTSSVGPSRLGSASSPGTMAPSEPSSEKKTGEKSRFIPCSHSSNSEAGAGSTVGRGRADAGRRRPSTPLSVSSNRRLSAGSSSAAWPTPASTLRLAPRSNDTRRAVSLLEGNSKSWSPAMRSVDDSHGKRTPPDRSRSHPLTCTAPAPSCSRSRQASASGGRRSANWREASSTCAAPVGSFSSAGSRMRGLNHPGLPSSGVTRDGPTE